MPDEFPPFKLVKVLPCVLVWLFRAYWVPIHKPQLGGVGFALDTSLVVTCRGPRGKTLSRDDNAKT